MPKGTDFNKQTWTKLCKKCVLILNEGCVIVIVKWQVSTDLIWFVLNLWVCAFNLGSPLVQIHSYNENNQFCFLLNPKNKGVDCV